MVNINKLTSNSNFPSSIIFGQDFQKKSKKNFFCIFFIKNGQKMNVEKTDFGFGFLILDHLGSSFSKKNRKKIFFIKSLSRAENNQSKKFRKTTNRFELLDPQNLWSNFIRKKFFSKKNCPLSKKIDTQKNFHKLTSDSSSSTSITLWSNFM